MWWENLDVVGVWVGRRFVVVVAEDLGCIEFVMVDFGRRYGKYTQP